MLNPLNAELMLVQADELRRELRSARNTPGARRWWRHERGAAAEQVGRRAR